MKKKFLSALLAGALVVSTFAADVNVFAAEEPHNPLTVERISHSDRKAGEIDGLLPFEMMGEETNRNQSYIWSVAEYGDYIYMGSCWNPISGIYYRNLQGNLSHLFESRGMDKQQASKKASALAKDVMDVMYHGNFPDGSTARNGSPFIARMNKYTNEFEIVYVESEKNAFVNWNGYRMAQVYNDKIYFVCAGYPTSRLIQIDPNTLESKIVLQKTAEDPGFSNGIRGLAVMDGKLIVSLATDGADPDHMFENNSKLPEAYKNAIREVAKKDVDFNDPNPTLKGARILTTTNPEDPSAWKVIANQDTFHDLPACYIADSINGGGVWDLVPFDGALYATMVTGKTNRETMENTKRGFAMYKGTPDANDNWTWTPIIGDKSKGAKYDFGLGIKESCAGNIFMYNDYLYIGGYNDPMLDLAEIGNEGDFELLYDDLKNPAHLYRMDKSGNIETINNDGFGAASTQYLWRFSEYNGKLFIGTFDIATLASGFTQLTDGSLLEMTPEDFMKELDYIKKLLQDLLSKEDATVMSLDETSNEVLDTDEINELINTVESMEAETNSIENGVETFSAGEDIVNLYLKMENIYFNKLKPVLDKIAPELSNKLETSITSKAFHHFVYYLGCSDIVDNQIKGCDILYSEDGVNFDVLTRNGFDDEFNHGGRAFIPTDNGLYVGMANPFWGTQLWKITDGTEVPTPGENVKPNPDEGGSEKPNPDEGGNVKPDTEDGNKPNPDESGNTKPNAEDKGTVTPEVDSNKPSTSKTPAVSDNVVETGDNSHVVLWGSTVVISFALLTAIILFKKKRA